MVQADHVWSHAAWPRLDPRVLHFCQHVAYPRDRRVEHRRGLWHHVRRLSDDDPVEITKPLLVTRV